MTRATSMGVSSRKLNDMAIERPHFVASLASIFAEGVVPVPGGVLILDAAGAVIGAAGASGDTSDNDDGGAHRRHRRGGAQELKRDDAQRARPIRSRHR